MELKNNRINVPVELITYAFQHDAVKALKIYVSLKFYCDGKIQIDSIYDIAKDFLGIKDKRTVRTHLEKLKQLNWIGFDSRTGNYFIRSFSNIRQQGYYKKLYGTSCLIKDLISLEAFFVGAVICNYLNVQKNLRVIQKRKNKAAVNNGHIAMQPYYLEHKHIGISLSKIAELFGCSQTRAHQLKALAVKFGYIKAKQKYRIWQRDLTPHVDLPKYYSLIPVIGKRLLLWRTQNHSLQLRERLYDQIDPLLRISKRKK